MAKLKRDTDNDKKETVFDRNRKRALKEKEIKDLEKLRHSLATDYLKQRLKVHKEAYEELSFSQLKTSEKAAKILAGAYNQGKKQFDTLKKGVDDYIGTYQDYFSFVTTRLVGTANSYDDIMATIKGGLKGTSSVSVLTVLKSLDKLISKGIANNVEQRAFLDSLSGKIATTFDATNSTLLQLIRLNRVDSTAAYLGMESSLTEKLNSEFMDTNYLTDNIQKSVSAAIYEATAQRGPTEGASFENKVQEWLGTFYSAGMQGSTVQNFAQGIGYLGSGDSASLVGNQQLNNMMAMASDLAGLDYSKLLTEGLGAEDVNKLLEGVYKQATKMANSGDKVAQKQFSSLFGMTMSDLVALSNITESSLERLSSSVMTYDNLIDRTDAELRKVDDRTSIREKFDNVIENIMAEIGEGIASSSAKYITYELARMAGPINVPMPFVGSVDITETVRSGLVGWEVFKSSVDIIKNVTGVLKGADLSLNDFGGAQGYGEGFSPSPGAISSTRALSSSFGVDEGAESDTLLGSLNKSDEYAQSITDSTKKDKSVSENILFQVEGVRSDLANMKTAILDNTYKIQRVESIHNNFLENNDEIA